tara:strand:- start:1307 stop:1414 length:108 start_codon:yes stop_codon:yes gene_type:complete
MDDNMIPLRKQEAMKGLTKKTGVRRMRGGGGVKKR